MGLQSSEIVFMKSVPKTEISYGFTYDNEPVVFIGGEEVTVSVSVRLYVMCLLNLEDWEKESTLREKYEMSLLIAEKIGLSKVINAVKFFSNYNNSILGKMELVMVESIPSSKEELSRKCDTIRGKYPSLDGIV